jgi:hypothetical protein
MIPGARFKMPLALGTKYGTNLIIRATKPLALSMKLAQQSQPSKTETVLPSNLATLAVAARTAKTDATIFALKCTLLLIRHILMGH